MSKGIDFKQKEVININDGKFIGFVIDVDANFNKGEIHSIIVSKNSNLISNLFGKNNITIPWEKINKIGEDVILVEL